MRKQLFTSRTLFDDLMLSKRLKRHNFGVLDESIQGSTQEVEIDDHDCPCSLFC